MRDPSPRAEFAAGAKAEVPVLFGVVPFGLIYGALALEAGIPPGAALAMSSVVLAGSAQFVGTQLFAAGAPGALIILTTFIVNLRHMLYSASVAPYLSRLGLRWKMLLAYLLTDEAYAMTITHYQQTGTPHRLCRLGAEREKIRGIGFSWAPGRRCGQRGRSARRSASTWARGSRRRGILSLRYP